MVQKFNEYINESLRDKMSSKPDEEILKNLEKMKASEALTKSIELGFLDGVKKAFKRLNVTQDWLNYGERKAAEDGFVDIIKFFIDKGANNNDVSLNTAFLNGHYDAFKYLLEQGADIKTLPGTRFDVYLPPNKKEKFRELFKKYGALEESLRDHMKPKSEEEFNIALKNILKGDDNLKILGQLYDVIHKGNPNYSWVTLVDETIWEFDNQWLINTILDKTNFGDNLENEIKDEKINTEVLAAVWDEIVEFNDDLTEEDYYSLMQEIVKSYDKEEFKKIIKDHIFYEIYANI